MNCAEAEPKLSWVLDGEAPEAAAHVAECAECRAKMEKLRAADPLLKQAALRWADEVPMARVKVEKGVFWRRVRVAAAALIAGWLGAWGWMNVRPVPEQDVLVIGSQVWSADAENVVRVIVRNGRTGQPLADARVKAEVEGGGTAEAVSGADGSAEIRVKAPGGDKAMILLTIASSEGTDRIERTVRLERPVRVMLSTDKPVYQPEQTIHIRALALNAVTSKPQPGDIAFEVQDADGRKVFRKTVRASEFGIASVDLDLADEVSTGAWKITARSGGVASERTVEVKRYVLPKFRVALETDRTFYTPGEKLVAAIDSDYFFGKPLSGALARVEMSLWSVDRFHDVAVARSTLDVEGRTSVEMQLPDQAYGTAHSGGAATIRVQAFVTDGAGHEESKSILVPFTDKPLTLHAIPESGEYVHGVSQNFFVLATYADGRPARVELKMEATGETASTDATGMAVMPLPHGAFALTARDRAGRTATLITDFETLTANRDFLLRIDRAELRAGETLNLEVLSRRDGTVYIDLVKAGQTWLTKSLEIRERRGTLALDLPTDIAGTVRLSAYRIGEDGEITRDTRILLVTRAEDLTIRPTPSKSEYLPGEDVEVGFEVVGADGKPVPSALGLSIVDEAVFALHDARPGMEGVFFRIEEDLLKPRVQFKEAERAVSSAPFPMRSAAAAQPQISSLGRVSFTSRAAEYAAATRRFNSRTEGIISVVGVVGVVCGFIFILSVGLQQMFGGGRMMFAVLLVSIFVLAALMLPALGSARKSSRGLLRESPKAPDAAAGNRTMPKPAHTRHDSSTPRLREFFPETLYWNPEIVTDDAGRATVRFQAADSITTWRMAMSAVSRDGRLSGGDSSLKVFQPFFADIDLPVALTQGDEVWIPVALYNYLPEAQTVTLTFDAESGFELLDPAERTIEVQPGNVSSVRFHVRARDFGRHAIKVTAIGPKFSDAIRRQIDVHPDGREVPFVVSDALQRKSVAKIVIPPDAVAGASRAWVRVFPSRFSEIVTGLEGLIRLPHG